MSAASSGVDSFGEKEGVNWSYQIYTKELALVTKQQASNRIVL